VLTGNRELWKGLEDPIIVKQFQYVKKAVAKICVNLQTVFPKIYIVMRQNSNGKSRYSARAMACALVNFMYARANVGDKAYLQHIEHSHDKLYLRDLEYIKNNEEFFLVALINYLRRDFIIAENIP
jgi:hypothetical protein